jgi:hypothetical protein
MGSCARRDIAAVRRQDTRRHAMPAQRCLWSATMPQSSRCSEKRQRTLEGIRRSAEGVKDDWRALACSEGKHCGVVATLPLGPAPIASAPGRRGVSAANLLGENCAQRPSALPRPATPA